MHDAFGMRHLFKMLIAVISLFLNYHPQDWILESSFGIAAYLNICATLPVSYSVHELVKMCFFVL